MNLLQFMPFDSFVNPGFWHKFSQIKLDVDRLDETPKLIWGFYNYFHQEDNKCVLEVDSTAFNSNCQQQNLIAPAQGILINKNTVEIFKETDKVALIQEIGSQIWNDIVTGEIFNNPLKLSRFLILSFADLKGFKYYYWFGFPVATNLVLHLQESPKFFHELFDQEDNDLLKLFNSIEKIEDKSYFCLIKTKKSFSLLTLSEFFKSENLNTYLTDLDNLYFTFVDPCNTVNPGWPLRNFLLLICYSCPNIYDKNVNILSFRLSHSKSGLTCKNSLVFKLNVPKFEAGFEETVFPRNQASNWTGWEKNERGKFGPRLANMAASMDPIRLADSAVDLNLKLMKWRILPDLNLEKIKNLKCLLLGAGTLGCSVARCLLGWGVRNITFVDKGHVSYSNPVRQSLFVHEDCVDSNKPKAEIAAESLKKIFPGVESKGFNFTIPMPGHSVGDSVLKEVEESVSLLTKLIEEHDVVFLLMDSRESRWLPTVLANFYKKIVINSALGFDTYLVMRHGYDVFQNPNIDEEKPSETNSRILRGDELGCYFCNDVTAPGNSMKDRTLDQQCTVTRPGVALIAASLAVELLISILQHKDGPYAKAYIYYKDHAVFNQDNDDNPLEDESLLGLVPHTIRGFLTSFNNLLITTKRYKNCIGCSNPVLQKYKEDKFKFLLQVFNSANILEDITGLTSIQKEIQMDEIWEMNDSDFETE